MPDRRALLRRAVATTLGAIAGGGCGKATPERLTPWPSGWAPKSPPRPAPPGVHNLGFGGERDGVLVVPDRAGLVPLIVMLHGATGSGRRAARLLEPVATASGCAILAPDSRDRTWDALLGGFGPDARFLERALADAALRCHLDPGRLAVAGFSDGATYALALGRANGDRFSHVLAFSPGFLIPTQRAGTPRIFVSHGRHDDVLPIERCSRVLVPRLRQEGYSVNYREFDGGHEVPGAVVREGVGLFAPPEG